MRPLPRRRIHVFCRTYGVKNASPISYRTEVLVILSRTEFALREHSFYIFLTAAIIAYLWPGPGLAITEFHLKTVEIFWIPFKVSGFTLLCMAVMLPGAYRFSPANFQSLLLAPRPMFICMSYIFLFAPALAVVFSIPLFMFFPADQAIQLAAGLALLSSAPVSPGAVIWLNPLRGDISFAAAMVAVSNFMAPLTVPAILYVAAGSAKVHIDLTLAQVMGPLILQVWVPILVMSLLKSWNQKVITDFRPAYGMIGLIAMNIANYAFIAKSAPIVGQYLSLASGLIVFALVMAYVSMLFLGSYWISYALGQLRMERITCMYLCSMRAPGTVLATDFPRIATESPLSVLPSIFIPFQHILGQWAYRVLLKQAKKVAGDLGQQVIRDLYVEYQLMPANDLGPRFWPAGSRPSSVWHRANVQSIDLSGLTTISATPIDPQSVVVLRIFHEKLSFPLEIKSVRTWQDRVAESEGIYVGNMRFLHVRPEWAAVLEEFLMNPVIESQQKNHAKKAISA